jgi:hypothetical protein
MKLANEMLLLLLFLLFLLYLLNTKTIKTTTKASTFFIFSLPRSLEIR